MYSFGLVLAQRRALQAAADAASLSGSWTVLSELSTDDRRDAQVLGSVVQFATSNGVPSDGTASDATYVSAVYVDATGAPLSPSVNVGSGGMFPTAARGVRVTVSNQIPTILPGFLKVWQILVQASGGSTAKPTASLPAASLVIPVGVLLSDARAAYVAHTTYDLFAHPLSGGQAPTLDFGSKGAPTYTDIPTNVRYWSDGQHLGAWQLSQPANVALVGGAYYDSVATGLQDNIRRQGLVDASNAAYALVTLPVFDSSTATTVHVSGFAQFKLRSADITASVARGMFVPYATVAWGTPSVPSTDVGPALIGLVP